MSTAVNTVLPQDKFDTAMTFVKPESAPTRVPLDKLAVLPGFNTRVKDADYNERVATIAESIAAHGFFDDKPFAVVMIPGDETVYIYDGEHRFDAAKQALLDGADFTDGLPVAWAKDGATVKDLTIHLAHGNNGERLNMVELAAVVRRMQGLKMDKAEIATALGRTARHVDNLFVLADANQTVKKAVASGQIAGAEAVKLLRKDPKTAAAKITEAVKAAEAKGKAKATPKTMADKPTGPKMKSIPVEQSMPEGETMGAVLKALAGKIREHVQIGGDDKLLETGMIRVRIEVIDHEAEAAKAKAAEEKAAAAAKREEERAAAAKKREEEKAAREATRAAEKKAADEKKAAEQAALAEAAKGAAKATGAKATAAKKAGAAKTTAAKASRGKAASGGKTAGAAQKPSGGDSGAKGTQVAPEAGSASSGPESGENGASDLPDESMGGL
jgi:ParB-like chromosome segregation protein Spo0J